MGIQIVRHFKIIMLCELNLFSEFIGGYAGQIKLGKRSEQVNEEVGWKEACVILNKKWVDLKNADLWA